MLDLFLGSFYALRRFRLDACRGLHCRLQALDTGTLKRSYALKPAIGLALEMSVPGFHVPDPHVVSVLYMHCYSLFGACRFPEKALLVLWHVNPENSRFIFGVSAGPCGAHERVERSALLTQLSALVP